LNEVFYGELQLSLLGKSLRNNWTKPFFKIETIAGILEKTKYNMVSSFDFNNGEIYDTKRLTEQ
jgi:hypothetical protein